MNLFEALKMAFNTIASYKLRTFLTMLGIIIGISSVIILVSLGKGTKQQVQGKIQNLGTNLIYVNIIGRGNKTALSYDETMGFAGLKGVMSISPVISQTGSVKRNEKLEDGIDIDGINTNYKDIRQLSMEHGRFIVPLDLDFRTQSAVLGSNIAHNLFGFVNPIGETVQINGVTFTVIGVLKAKGSSIVGSEDDRVFIPATTEERTFYANGIKSIFIQAQNSNAVPTVLKNVNKNLKILFKNDDSSYKVTNEQDMLDTANSVSNLMTLMLTGIASISLLVGGIGIMNIMLVSVTERTKEIGIRKAIGAKRRDILFQFLIESVLITLLAGLIGICLGISGTYLLKFVSGIQTLLSGAVVWLSLGFSIAIGLVFGILPAYKASKLNPIEALHFE